MPLINWSANLDGQPYTIELNHNLFSGKKLIQVNGVNVHESKSSKSISELPFQIAAHDCKIAIRAIAGVTYNLYVDEKLQETQQYKQSQILKSMPLWGWLFVLINGFNCALVVNTIFDRGSLGSTLSILIFVIYIGVALEIWIISADRARTIGRRVALCIVSTIIFSIIPASLITLTSN